MAKKHEFVTLSNGVKMPLLGIGTWQSKPEEVIPAIESALDTGYRHIDTAFGYQNEEAIGKVLTQRFKDGKLKREDIFVTTKLFGYFFHQKDVVPVLKEQLQHLGLDYVDQYLIHFPTACIDGSVEDFRKKGTLFPMDMNTGKMLGQHIDHKETWQGMEEAYNQGLAKSIGLSNFNSKQIQYVYDNATVKPHALQVECHAYFPQFELQAFCKKLNIEFVAYAPIGSPGLKQFVKNVFGKDIEQPMLIEDPMVKKIAEFHKKTPAQVLIRWLLERDICAIPKSINPKRVVENFQVYDFELTADDNATLNKIGADKPRMFDFDWASEHPDYPFNEKF